MGNSEIKAAQKKLNNLCKQYGVEKFSIENKVGLVCWQKLVQAMCGIDINQHEKPGRKANSDELIDNVRKLYALHTDFSRFEISDDKNKSKKTRYKKLPDFREKEIHGLIAKSLSKTYGMKITAEKVRGILNNRHNRNQLKKLADKEFDELKNTPFNPDDMSGT